MSRPISVQLPPSVSRADIEAMCARSRKQQRQRHHGYRFVRRGDTVRGKTVIGIGTRRTPARLKVRITPSPAGIRLEGNFRVSRVWDVLYGFVLLICIGGLIIGLVQWIWQAMLIFGLGSPVFAGLLFFSQRMRVDDEQWYGDEVCAVLLQDLGVATEAG